LAVVPVTALVPVAALLRIPMFQAAPDASPPVRVGTSVGDITAGHQCAIAILAIPAFSGAATYAIGKVFIRHFESGGTFLDLDTAKVKAYFSEQYDKGKKLVGLGKEKTSKAAA